MEQGPIPCSTQLSLRLKSRIHRVQFFVNKNGLALKGSRGVPNNTPNHFSNDSQTLEH